MLEHPIVLGFFVASRKMTNKKSKETSLGKTMDMEMRMGMGVGVEREKAGVRARSSSSKTTWKRSRRNGG